MTDLFGDLFGHP